MRQLELFPILINSDLIDTYNENKKELRRVEKILGKYRPLNHIDFDKETYPSLSFKNPNGTFCLKKYKLEREVNDLNKEIAGVIHFYSNRRSMLLEWFRIFNNLIDEAHF